jgi:hypothetical protein
VNRKSLSAAFACALLTFSLLGCGATNKLQNIQLSTSNQSETTMGTQNLIGDTDTIQLYAWANYTNGKSVLLHGAGLTYNIALDPIYNVDAFGNLLPQPSQAVQLSSTGELTAFDQAFCTWVDTSAVVTVGTTPTPSWAISGQYDVTATFQGMTSAPVAVALADTGGDAYYPYFDMDAQNLNNPDGLCGPTSN